MLTPKDEPSIIGLVGLLSGLVGGHYDARMARGRERLIVGAALLFFTVLLAAMLAYNAWLGDRFVNHSVIVDARLVDRVDIQCIGASGGGLLGSGTNTWWVEFPVPTGLHQTRLVHPCDVTPPDFGRGRGYMWMQYDKDNYGGFNWSSQHLDPGGVRGNRGLEEEDQRCAGGFASAVAC